MASQKKSSEKSASKTASTKSEGSSLDLTQVQKPTKFAITPSQQPSLGVLVTQGIDGLTAIDNSLGATPAVSSQGKKRLTKMRKGGEPIAGAIGALAQQHKAETGSLQVAPMNEAFAQAATLQPLVTYAIAFLQRLLNRVFLLQSSGWSDALQLYNVLKRMAKTDDSLAAALAPVTDFMAYRHPSTKVAGEPTKPQQHELKKGVDEVTKVDPSLLVPAAASTATATKANGSSSQGS